MRPAPWKAERPRTRCRPMTSSGLTHPERLPSRWHSWQRRDSNQPEDTPRPIIQKCIPRIEDLANRHQVAKDGRTGRTGPTASGTRHLEKTIEHDNLFRISPQLSTIERARPLGDEIPCLRMNKKWASMRIAVMSGNTRTWAAKKRFISPCPTEEPPSRRER